MLRLRLIRKPPEERELFWGYFRAWHGWRNALAALSVSFVILTASNVWWLDLCDLGVLVLAWTEYTLHVCDDVRRHHDRHQWKD